MALHPLFAILSFGSIAMLSWGLAAAVPILIHLWSRQRYQEVTWAAVSFLLTAVRQSSRRIRFERLLLLAVRVLTLLLFSLALTDVSCNTASPIGSALPSQVPRHTVVVLDGSFSMDYRRSGKSHFEKARQLAISLVEHGRRGDGFTLVLMSDPPQVIIPSPAFAPADVISELQNVKLRHGGADLPSTLAEIRDIIESARKEYPRLKQCQVFFLTDLGRNTWGESTSEECQQQIAELARQARLLLVDLGEPGVENLAITRMSASNPFATINGDVTFQAAVKNFGTQQRVRHEFQFFVDNQLVHRGMIDIDAGEQTTATVSHRFEIPGEHVVEARLADDSLLVDNRRWLSVPVRESIRVLCVAGKPGAARHLAFALEPRLSGRRRVYPQIIPESALLEHDLPNYDCVFLCNVSRFGPQEADILREYVNKGGGVVVFLGDQVTPDSYNRELGGQALGQRLLPAQIGEIISEPQYGFNPLDYQHEIAKPFQGNEQAGLLTTPVWRYFRLQPVESTRIRVALAFGNGDPVILDEVVGGGRILLVATAASTASMDRSSDPPVRWTAFSIWPSFAPVVQEMLSLAVRGRFRQRNVEVGQVLGSTVRAGGPSILLEVVDPSGNIETVRPSYAGTDARWIYTGTDTAGIYTARFGTPLSSNQLFTANVDARESDLERVLPEELPPEFEREVQDIDNPDSLAKVDDRWALFRYLLGTVLVCLLVETYLAWRMGNASA